MNIFFTSVYFHFLKLYFEIEIKKPLNLKLVLRCGCPLSPRILKLL